MIVHSSNTLEPVRDKIAILKLIHPGFVAYGMQIKAKG